MRAMWDLPNLMSLLSIVAGTLLITIGTVGRLVFLSAVNGNAPG